MHQRSSQFYHKALAFSFCLALLIGCGKPISRSEPVTRKSIHQGVSEHILFDISMSMNFELLPLKGEVRKDKKYWSGDSWRHSRGSINLRWNSPERIGFNYLSPTPRDIFTYPVNRMKQLSPAEKYDLYKGRYDYPLKWEVDLFARGGIAEWEGICHGWAGASINHDQPKPKTVVNPDGIEIYFGSSDIKALASYAYSKVLIRNEDSLGRRCEEQGFLDESCNDDLTPESFHAVLTNKIGLRGQTVIADLDRFKEVWNHPIVKYESVIEKKTGTAEKKKVVVRTKITYVDVVEKNSWEPHSSVFGVMTTKYELDLDERGNIVSGKWLSRDRPDFMWTISQAVKFEGYLDDVMTLLK